MNCPRCAAPVKGDFKYCPECACRLRPEVRETDAETSSHGPMVLVVSAILLVLGGILVGWQIVGDRGNEVRVVIDPPVRQFLRMSDFPDSFAPVPKGIAWYDRNDEVLAVPPEVLDKILLRVPEEDRDAFLESARNDPASLTRWGALLSFFYEHTEDVVWTRTREEPVWVQEFQCMRYEVTRGQYKEFLLAVEQEPALLSRLPWVRELWWGTDGSRPEPATDPEARKQQEARARYLVYLARRYREEWWNAVLEHHDRRETARRSELMREAFAKGQLVLGANPDELEPEERELRMRDVYDAKFPPPPPPERPVWLGPTNPDVLVEDLRAMTPAQAVFLLVPPSWIRIDDDGRVTWSSDESTNDWPITNIAWWDTQMFIAWARRVTGDPNLRLPTWAEWTRAAHGGNARRAPDDFDSDGAPGWDWPWGSQVDIHGCNNRHYVKNDEVGPTLRSVRETYGWHGRRSAEGLLNMAGNAAEWTSNIASYYYSDADGTLYAGYSDADESLAKGAFVCGGSFLDGLDDCKTTSRTTLDKSLRREWVGFRLVTTSTF